MQRLAVVGVGNMGEALVRGIVRAGVLAPERIAISDVRREMAARLAAELGVAAASLDRALDGADTVVLAVKPQGMDAVLEALAERVAPGTVVLSVAAGVPIAAIEGALAGGVEVVRTMPNTPALIGLGASAFSLGRVRSGRGEAVARAVLGAVGLVVAVDERALDAVTALSGSGPAYVFHLLEAMIAAGEAVGLDAEVARVLARQTLIGAATLAQGEVPPEELRRRVTSPGGTTAAALGVLERRGWARILGQAIAAARDRGAALGRGDTAEVVPADALALARSALAHGEHPVAVLDVDLTLIENGPRTRQVIADWLGALPLEPGRVARAIEHARTMPLVFSIRDNLRAVAAVLGRDDDGELLATGFAHWRHGFFDPDNLVHDVALDGAAEAVQRLVAAGVTVVYLTARPHEMAAGTVASMRALGFPIGVPHTVLATKPPGPETDQAFKVAALSWCARLGRVVLLAENEPAHANEMQRAFPEALTVLVGTRHSPRAPEPLAGVVRVARLLDVVPDGAASSSSS